MTSAELSGTDSVGRVAHYRIFIDGEHVDSDEGYQLVNPADEELVATVAKGSVRHADRAVAAAKRVHETRVWSDVPPAERAAILEWAADRLEARSDELTALGSRENGSTVRLSGPFSVGQPVAFTRAVNDGLKGHEYAKCQASKAGITFSELSNGFAATSDPVGLQAICDRLGPATINAFAQRWFAVLPLPLTEHDRDSGYWWELSMRQIEVSHTIVFHAPRHARAFFEALVADNLDIGRPERVEFIFAGRRARPGRKPASEVFKTKLVTRGVDVTQYESAGRRRDGAISREGSVRRVALSSSSASGSGSVMPAPAATPTPRASAASPAA